MKLWIRYLLPLTMLILYYIWGFEFVAIILGCLLILIIADKRLIEINVVNSNINRKVKKK